MMNKHTCIAAFAIAAALQSTHAFSTQSISNRPVKSSSQHKYVVSDMALSEQYFVATPDEEEINEIANMLLETPPMVKAPVVATKKATAPSKKKKIPAHAEGVFSPVVVAAASILGQDQLNKLRAKGIALHSDVIKGFVDSADSPFGQAVLRQLFAIVDTDKSGSLDKDELASALKALNFSWLKDKQVSKIFERADSNSDNEISLEEFIAEAPKTLRVNLVKLAKNNGGEMGLLV
mmetsp:Transcript_32447/g.78536  ORF Transcript_32447/g.78536 Transcript_32447/m.78536 type:complete len:235 (-) Transcript_32447:3166-3870(-)